MKRVAVSFVLVLVTFFTSYAFGTIIESISDSLCGGPCFEDVYLD